MMRLRNLTIALTAITLSLITITQDGFARTEYNRHSSTSPGFVGKVAADPPFVTVAAHNIGKMGLAVSNQGHFGTGFFGVDECDGAPCPSADYPLGSNIQYLFAGAIWVGAIVGRDTLVSVAADGWSSVQEMWPASFDEQVAHNELMTIRSISDPDSPGFEFAKSEKDITCAFFDTNTVVVPPDAYDNTPHRPLGIQLRQTTYSWSYEYAEDFVLFDYKITNIGSRELQNVYFALYVDGDVGNLEDNAQVHTDDICGFKLDVDQLALGNTNCEFTDTIRIAWIADNDGNNQDGSEPNKGPSFEDFDPSGVTGTRVVRTPSDSLKFSFNWWISNQDANLDFGPRKQGTETDPFRDFGGFLGTPEGDRNKYYIMSHEEFDYDQLRSAVNQTSDGWLPPDPVRAADFADGFDTRYLLSFGPFIVFPGETLPLTFAYVGGEKFHRDPHHMADNFSALAPQDYIDLLDFSDLGVNAQWASWIYDNPGVDTDGDLYAGKYRYCFDSSSVDTVADTYMTDSMIDSIIVREVFADTQIIWYEGDGVPDFNGANPPPPPVLLTSDGQSRIEPSDGKFIVRFNGLRSETTPDNFSDEFDFEGYRIYAGLEKRSDAMVLHSSYDRKNYTPRAWDPDAEEWLIVGTPLTLAQVRFLYANNNPDYDPLDNGIDNPLRVGDSLLYFSKQDFNQDDLTDTTEIFRPAKYRYNYNPDGSIMTRMDTVSGKLDTIETPYPHTLDAALAFTSDTFLIDSLTGDTIWYMGGELTEDGKWFKYFEYEYRLDNLLPSQPYWVSVTAFDYGAPQSGLASLETNRLVNAVQEYPLPNSNAVASNDLDVIVYPNPYRIDGNYREQGFEGRGSDLPEERLRRVHFVNLPPKCTIRIFTLDGDLVRELNHNTTANSPTSMHAEWDLVTRNTQMAVSGIYYWTVENEQNGKVQTGKLVLIM